MRIKTIPLIGCLLFAVVGLGVLAEEGGDAGGDPKDQCPFGIIEGPDPIGFADCLEEVEESSSKRSEKSSRTGPIVLPNSARSAHGRPDFGRDLQTGQPFMVWADRNSGEHDIAFTTWGAEGWGRVEYLTSSLLDERDPRAFATSEGAVYVSWWVDGTLPSVYFSVRDPKNDRWTEGLQVATNASHPSIAVVDGRVWVAFERDTAAGVRQVVLASELPDGGFAERIVASSLRSRPLDVELHLDSGSLWLDWKQSDDVFGYVESRDGHWSGMMTEPWVNHSWAGEQETRAKIRDLLLAR